MNEERKIGTQNMSSFGLTRAFRSERASGKKCEWCEDMSKNKLHFHRNNCLNVTGFEFPVALL